LLGDREDRRAQHDFRPFVGIDHCRGHSAAVDGEPQRPHRFDLQLASGCRLDPQVLLFNGKIGQMDVVFGCAPDHQAGLIELPLTNDLAPAGGMVDGSDQEHNPLNPNNRIR